MNGFNNTEASGKICERIAYGLGGRGARGAGGALVACRRGGRRPTPSVPRAISAYKTWLLPDYCERIIYPDFYSKNV